MAAVSPEDLERARNKNRALLYQQYVQEAEDADAKDNRVQSPNKIGNMQGKKIIDRTHDFALAMMVIFFQRANQK